MTILQAENLSFAFGHVALLDKASFQLAAGDKVGLIGRNGAGKSSLLKILAGVQKPDDGQLILQNGLKTVYVPQESFFDGAATVFDIVSEGLGSLRDVLRRCHEIGRELANEQNDSLIKELNELQNQIEAQNGWRFDALVSQTIGELGLPENEKIANLSGGQKKRVALAQAWVQKPDILLLDEPTNDLDIDTQELLEELLRDYAGTVFLVSHDRMFLDNVITQSIVFEGEGRLKEYIGGYQDYADAKAREEKVQAASPPPPSPKGRLKKTFQVAHTKLCFKWFIKPCPCSNPPCRFPTSFSAILPTLTI